MLIQIGGCCNVYKYILKQDLVRFLCRVCSAVIVSIYILKYFGLHEGFC